MPQSLTPLALQIEVNHGPSLNAGVLLQVLKACFTDDIQPIVFPPLELFGDTLMADRGRIDLGSKVLGHRRKAILKPLSVQVAPPDIANVVRSNFRLTSVFLFAAACSVTLKVEETSMLIFEMMSLGGSAQKYAITSAPIFDFVELLNGFRDHFKKPEKSPYSIYRDFSEIVMSCMRETNTWITGLHDSHDPRLTGKLLFELFDALRVEDVHLVELEGSQGGMWISFLFIWMRPKETEVFLEDKCVYSRAAETNDQAHGRPRLLIRLQNKQTGTIASSPNGWNIKRWEATDCVTQQLKISQTQELGQKYSLTYLPWNTARNQIELLYPGRADVVMAIGHLAGALINLSTEHGLIQRGIDTMPFSGNAVPNPMEDPALPLLELCSNVYASKYPQVMRSFGWTDAFTLDMNRQDRISAVLHTTLTRSKLLGRGTHAIEVRNFITFAVNGWQRTQGESMLVDDPCLQDDIIDHAVNFTAQALASSLHRDSLSNPIFFPLDKTRLINNGNLLWEMLLCSSDAPGTGRRLPMGVRIDTLRSAAISAAMQLKDIEANDLAVSSDGYVVFSSVLEQEERAYNEAGKRRNSNRAFPLSERRMTGTIEILPGCIRHGTNGTYKKLVGDATDLGGNDESRIEELCQPALFHVNGQVRGPTDDEARDASDIEVKYLIRQDDRHKAIYVATQLQIRDACGDRKNCPATLVPASWVRSIDAVTFAQHITEMTSRLSQLTLWPTGGEE